MSNRLVLAVASALLLGCASTSQDPGREESDDTFVCVENQSDFSVTVNVRDASGVSRLGQIHVSPFGTARRRIRTGGFRPIMVSIDAVGLPQEWVPPAFSRIVVSPGVSLSLRVGEHGITPFAHSSVGGGCPHRVRRTRPPDR